MMKFNDDIDPKDFEGMKPALWILLTRTILYCETHSLPLIITSLRSDRLKVESVSRTHDEGRALDISVRDWPSVHVERFKYLMNKDYSDIAAISFSDHRPRAVVFHNVGYGLHLHLQVRPNANVNRFVKE